MHFQSFLDQVQTLMDKQEGGKVGKGEGGTDSTVSLMCQGELIEPSLPFSVLLDTDRKFPRKTYIHACHGKAIHIHPQPERVFAAPTAVFLWLPRLLEPT